MKQNNENYPQEIFWAAPFLPLPSDSFSISYQFVHFLAVEDHTA